jgi:predicted adenylyl cyclase CyaB
MISPSGDHNDGMHEVERRYKTDEAMATTLQARLEALGFQQSESTRQIDEYFTSETHDFIVSEECLRIRQTNGLTLMTWKPPSSDQIKAAQDYWKPEIEFAVDASADTARSFLTSLRFIPYVVVDKLRTSYRRGTVEVAIDDVASAGYFVEVEIQSVDVDAARAELDSIAKELGIDGYPQSTIPYRDIVKAYSE